MTKKEIPKRETTQFIEDEIFKERIRKENMNQVDYEVFQPSLDSLREATPDKPGIDSFCSRLYSQSKEKAIDDDDDSPEFQTFKHTMFMTSRDVSPQQKYSEPLTTTMNRMIINRSNLCLIIDIKRLTSLAFLQNGIQMQM